MSPEPEEILDWLGKKLFSRVNNNAQEVIGEAHRALDARDTRSARQQTDKYDALLQTGAKFQEKIIFVRESIDELRKSGVNVTLSDEELRELANLSSRTEILQKITSPRKEGRKSVIYKTDYVGILGLDLIKQDEKGNFVFNDAKAIAKDMLVQDKANDPRFRHTAEVWFYRTRKTLSQEILEKAEAKKAASMSELATDVITDPRTSLGPNMEEFYRLSSKAYPEYPPKKFVNEVLNRKFGRVSKVNTPEVKKK